MKIAGFYDFASVPVREETDAEVARAEECEALASDLHDRAVKARDAAKAFVLAMDDLELDAFSCVAMGWDWEDITLTVADLAKVTDEQIDAWAVSEADEVTA